MSPRTEAPARPAAPSSRLDRTLWPALLLLAAVCAVFAGTDLDLIVQDWFYDAANARWLVDGHDTFGRLLFYQGPKVVIAAIGLGPVS